MLVGPSAACSPIPVGVALNPLSPFPGISFPFRGSWFLFTFSTLASVSELSSTAGDTFGMLSITKAFSPNLATVLSTSAWVALSFADKAWASNSAAFASSIVFDVLLLISTLSIADWIREIASDNLLKSTFAIFSGASLSSLTKASAEVTTGLETGSLEGISSLLVSGLATFSSWFRLSWDGDDCWLDKFELVLASFPWIVSAFAVAPPPNIIKAAIATDAAPKLYFRIENRWTFCPWYFFIREYITTPFLIFLFTSRKVSKILKLILRKSLTSPIV